MKTFKDFKIQSLGRKLGVLGLTVLLATSCGSDNESSDDSSSSTSSSTLSSNDSSFSSSWESLKSSYTCSYGRASDRYYYSASNTNSLTEGSMSGTSIDKWFGVNFDTGDVLAVQKVSNGSSVYYNVVLSTCIISSSYGGSTLYALDDSDSLTNLSLPSYYVMNDSYSANCNHGFISNAYLTFISSNAASYGRRQFSTDYNCY